MLKKVSCMWAIGVLIIAFSGIAFSKDAKVVFPESFKDTGMKVKDCKVVFAKIIKNGGEEELSILQESRSITSDSDGYAVAIPYKKPNEKFALLFQHKGRDLADLVFSKEGEIHIPHFCKVTLDASEYQHNTRLSIYKSGRYSEFEYQLAQRMNYKYLFRYVPAGKLHFTTKNRLTHIKIKRTVIVPETKEFTIKLTQKSKRHLVNIETTPKTPLAENIVEVKMLQPRIYEWIVSKNYCFVLQHHAHKYMILEHEGKLVTVLPGDVKANDQKDLYVGVSSMDRRSHGDEGLSALYKMVTNKDGSLQFPRMVLAHLDVSYLEKMNKEMKAIFEDSEVDYKVVYISKFIRFDDKDAVFSNQDIYAGFGCGLLESNKKTLLLRAGEYEAEVSEYDYGTKNTGIVRPINKVDREGKDVFLVKDYFHKDLPNKFTIPAVDEVNLIFEPSMEHMSLWRIERVKKKK